MITDDSVYVFEFKITGGKFEKTAEAALEQIDEKDYLGPYRASGKRLIKVGAVYSTIERESGDVKIQAVSLLSGYKLNNINCLPVASSEDVYFCSENTCKMGFFSKREILKICKIV